MNESTHHRQTPAVIRRLSRTEGHIRAIKRMLAEDRACPDILVQLSAVKAALDQAARIVLADHLESCLRSAVANGTVDEEWLNLKKALDTFIS